MEEDTPIEPFDIGPHISGKPFGARFVSTVCFQGNADNSKPSCPNICAAVIASGATDWSVHAPSPGKEHFDVLTHPKVNRDDVRRAIYCHPPVAMETHRLIKQKWDLMTDEKRARCSLPHKSLVEVDETDRRAVASAVMTFFCDSKNGKIKLMKNRLLSVKNTAMWKKRVTNAAEIETETQRKASIALDLKTLRWHHEMVAVHRRIANASAQRLVGKNGNEPFSTTVVTGAGTPHLTVARHDPTAGIKGYRLVKYAAPSGMGWLASDSSVGVAISSGKIVVCLLPWKGGAAVPAASSVKLGADILPDIATAAVANGSIFYSYYGAICRSPFGPRYEGATSLSRTVMELPGTSTIVPMHDGHTIFCVNSQYGVVWSQAQLPGVRRISVVSWNPETPITGEELKGRASGRYNRPSKSPSGPFKVYDSLPAGLVSGTPIPAVACGDTMVACQVGSLVHLVHVPFVGVGPVPPEWVHEEWGSIQGKLLAACVTPEDAVRLATTTGVYDSDTEFAEMKTCTSASWFGPETLLRDDEMIGVALPQASTDDRPGKRRRIYGGTGAR